MPGSRGGGRGEFAGGEFRLLCLHLLSLGSASRVTFWRCCCLTLHHVFHVFYNNGLTVFATIPYLFIFNKFLLFLISPNELFQYLAFFFLDLLTHHSPQEC